jgi:ATP-dependent helicase/nuclease subunit A
MSAALPGLIRERLAEQRRAADPRRSVWVTASAGTGKTAVLIDRVLRLLLEDVPPGRILCMTFTEAAAKEMANRVNAELIGWSIAPTADLTQAIRALLGAAPEPAIVARARRLFARTVATPGGLKIVTLHGFCKSVLRRFPLEAGVATHFEVIEERTAKDLLREAMREVLDRLAAVDTDLTKLLSPIAEVISLETFAGFVQTIDKARTRIAACIEARKDLAGAIAALRRLLGLQPGDTKASLLAAGCAEGTCARADLTRVAALMRQGQKSDRKYASAIAEWLAGDPAARQAKYASYRSVFLTAEGSIRVNLATAPVLARAPEVEGILRAEAQRVADLEMRLEAERIASGTEAVLALGREIAAAYAARKAARGLLDFDDLIQATERLLTRAGLAPWVLYKLDGGLDHVLVDEAQDTSPSQWRIVEALVEEFFAGRAAAARPRTLFCVGDPKQSIFSFQNADLAGYLAAEGRLTAAALKSGAGIDAVPLTRSFRSVPAILQAVDATYARAGAADGVLPAGGVMRHTAHRAGEGGKVELWPLAIADVAGEEDIWAVRQAREPESDPDLRLARVLAHHIGHWVGPTGAADPDAQLPARGRQMRAGDILVLVRRRTAFTNELVGMLKRLDVPVAGVDRLVLSQQLAIKDLIRLAEFLCLPEDDLSLAIVLRSPLFDIAEATLMELAIARTGSLWTALQARAATAPELRPAAERLQLLLARADFVRPHELFAELLDALDGRRAMLQRLGQEANDPLDEFLGLTLAYERSAPPSLQGFLRWFDSGDVESRRDLESARDKVRIMTVHGAKGLQAPVVILHETTKLSNRLDPPLWISDGIGALPVWSSTKPVHEPVTLRARGLAERERDAEYRRLLYVAMTRAEDRLIICGTQPENQKQLDPGCWYELARAGLATIAPEVEIDLKRGATDEGWIGMGYRLELPQQIAVAATAAMELETSLPPLPAWALAPEPLQEPPSQVLSPSSFQLEAPPVLSPAGTDPGRFRRGYLIHRMLQSLPDLPLAERGPAADRYLERFGPEFSPQMRRAIAAETLAVMADPGHAELFAGAARAEVPIAGEIVARDGRKLTVVGQVDRLLVEPSRVCLVDYKTNRPPPEDPAQVPRAYLRQMAAYRALLAQIYPGVPIQCSLLWTVGPRIMLLPDALLDENIP